MIFSERLRLKTSWDTGLDTTSPRKSARALLGGKRHTHPLGRLAMQYQMDTLVMLELLALVIAIEETNEQ